MIPRLHTRTVVVLLLLVFIGNPGVHAQNRSYPVGKTVAIVDGTMTPFDQVKPGDTLLFEAGVRNFIIVRNILGEENNPVIIVNDQGIVEFDADHYFAISIRNCRYFRLTGTGNPDHFYGFKITRVTEGTGIGIVDLSSDFEIDHVSIENAQGVGISAKTDPDCLFNTTRDKFTQFHTLIHDNYLSNIGREGMYIGSTKYYGQNFNCEGKDTLLMPHLLDGVRIYNNIIRYTGWDGIQVSSASNDCQLYDNIVMYDSQEGFYNQMSGIIIGGGSKCDCYNNFISHGKGNGIESHGLGGFSIYNNIIEEAGRTYLPLDSSEMRHGMYIANDALPDSSFTILFNNIIRPKSDGIRFDNTSGKNNLIASNVIIDPGNYDFYENGATSHSGEDAYIMLPEIPIDILVTNNYFRRSIDSAMFDTIGYSPVQGSPLIDAGYGENNSVGLDLYHRPRLHGSTYDIGAVEYDPKYQGVNENPSSGKYRLLLFPNPAEDSFNLQFSLSKREEVVIDIYALQGKRIYHATLGKLDKGVHNQVVDTRLFEPGLYLFQLKTTGQVIPGRFIKGKK